MNYLRYLLGLKQNVKQLFNVNASGSRNRISYRNEFQQKIEYLVSEFASLQSLVETAAPIGPNMETDHQYGVFDFIMQSKGQSNSPKNVGEKKTVQNNVVKLLEKNGPLSLGRVGQCYVDEFQHRLDYKSLGFGKLSTFFMSLKALGVALSHDPKLGTSHCIAELKNKVPLKIKGVSDPFTQAEYKKAQENVVKLLEKNGPICLDRMGRCYTDEFQHRLDHKSLGFGKLSTFLKSLQAVGVALTNDPQHGTSHCIAELKSTVPIETRDVPNPATQVDDDISDDSKPPTRSMLEEEVEVEIAATYVEVTKSKKQNEAPSFQDMEGLITYFHGTKVMSHSVVAENHTALVSQQDMNQLPSAALLGTLTLDNSSAQGVYLNTHAPFCFAAVGVQGTGKSHSLGCVLESCLLPVKVDDVLHLKKPMTCLVLHYDQNTSSVCEATGLINPDDRLESCFKRLNINANVPKSNAIVLVSPTFYKQRKAFYGDYCNVKPLLFNWNTLTADHIKRIMHIQEGDSQLYVASLLNMLRSYQRKGVMPKFSDFILEVKDLCSVGSQIGPLQQRIALLETFIADSNVNKSICEESHDIASVCNEGCSLIIADMTDPLLSKGEANSLFQVLTEQFRAVHLDNGKLLALDEAHKFMDGIHSDGLSQAIVNVARLMRHDGMRLAVSTQSPKALAPELLELVSVALIHRFHSRDWWTYLQSKLPLTDDNFDKILNLQPGNALAFAASHSLEGYTYDKGIVPIRVRPRFTADRGTSQTND